MKRVYLDSNIFRYINKEDLEEEHSTLLEKLQSSQDGYLYIYSFAHLLDLSKDKTHHKFDDLDYMEGVVGNNYILLDTHLNSVRHLPLPPKEAFNRLKKTENEQFDFLELMKEISSGTRIEYTENLDSKIISKTLQKVPEHLRPLFKALLSPADSQKGNYSKEQAIVDLFANKSSYREIRDFSAKELNLKTKYKLDIRDIDFLKIAPDNPVLMIFLGLLEMSFFSLNPQERKTHTFFTSAYLLLNLLVIDNEKNKRIIVDSMYFDSLHFYFGAHCGYLVTEDKGLYNKSKFLYKLFGIKTKVLTIAEFNLLPNDILKTQETDLPSYLEFLRYSLKNPKSATNEKPNFITATERKIYELKAAHFGYFDCVLKEYDNYSSNYHFCKNPINFPQFIIASEIEIVTNNIAELFGLDIRGNGSFSPSETKELLEEKWRGREWIMGELAFKLAYEDQNLILSFQAPDDFLYNLYTG